MMNAVEVQITMVSTNTPSDCTKPCLTGWDTVAVAAAFGALPMPASFENRPALDSVQHGRSDAAGESTGEFARSRTHRR